MPSSKRWSQAQSDRSSARPARSLCAGTIARYALPPVAEAEARSQSPAMNDVTEQTGSYLSKERKKTTATFTFGGTLAAHWTGRTKEIPVPSTWLQAHSVFWLHPTPLAAVLILCGLALLRTTAPISPLVDVVVLAVGVMLWVCQEWFVHAKLMHGSIESFVKDIHHQHHKEPYYQISIDGPDITVPFMLLSTTLMTLLLGQSSGSTLALGYISMGLCYQFVHFAVHTKAVPTSKLGRRIRQIHMQHHCRNENYWLSFTCPAFDSWMGTNPAPSTVPLTDLARAAVQGKRDVKGDMVGERPEWA